jgi:hypothetical protein
VIDKWIPLLVMHESSDGPKRTVYHAGSENRKLKMKIMVAKLGVPIKLRSAGEGEKTWNT